MSIAKLLPERRSSWFVWILLFTVVLPIYYLKWPYPRFSGYYREHVWRQACPGNSCDVRRLKIDALVPQYAADFTEVPLRITVENVYTETIDTTITLSVTLQGASPDDERKAYTTVNGKEQNAITLRDVPPHGVETVIFMLRVPAPPKTDTAKYRVQILVNGDPINFSIRRDIEFNRIEVFRLWMIKYPLSPPSSNVVIPVGLLLLVSLGEYTFREASKKSLHELYAPVPALALSILILAVISTSFWAWKEVATGILVMTLVAIGTGWLLANSGSTPADDEDTAVVKPVIRKEPPASSNEDQ